MKQIINKPFLLAEDLGNQDKRSHDRAKFEYPLTFTTCNSSEIYEVVEEHGERLFGGVHATGAWPYKPTESASLVNTYMPRLKHIADLHMPSLGGQDHQVLLSPRKVEEDWDTVRKLHAQHEQRQDRMENGVTLSIQRCAETGMAEINITTRYYDHTDRSIELASEEAYNDLFFTLRELELRPLRIWNTMPHINENADESGNGLDEYYKQFNTGRRKAWLEYDSSLETVCAATGIGNFDPASVITIRCLATPHEVVNIENPNQISFLEYSTKYGSPPSSRRGTIHLLPEGLEVYIAGTASIVGEENRYCGDHELKDVAQQTRQTLENIKMLISRDNLTKQIPKEKLGGREIPEYGLGNLQAVRVYIRNPEDKRIIQRVIEAEYGLSPAQIMYLQSEVCRKPLDVEIEALAK